MWVRPYSPWDERERAEKEDEESRADARVVLTASTSGDLPAGPGPRTTAHSYNLERIIVDGILYVAQIVCQGIFYTVYCGYQGREGDRDKEDHPPCLDRADRLSS